MSHAPELSHETPAPVKQHSVEAQPLPAQRAFVVQIHAAAPVADRSLAGRVEHVVSGRATHFGSVDELLAFMARVLDVPDSQLEEPTQAMRTAMRQAR